MPDRIYIASLNTSRLRGRPRAKWMRTPLPTMFEPCDTLADFESETWLVWARTKRSAREAVKQHLTQYPAVRLEGVELPDP